MPEQTVAPPARTGDRLSGRVALVAGAGSAIGRGISLRLAREGASIILVDADRDEATLALEQIREAGGVAHVGASAPPQRADAERIVADALSRFGRIDILVAGADYRTPWEPLADKSATSFDRALRSFHEAVILM